MIVVNSVMEGFAREMQGRIHGILSDVVFESNNLEGFEDAEAASWRRFAKLLAICRRHDPDRGCAGALPAFKYVIGQTRHVSLIGIDDDLWHSERLQSYLQHPKNREHLTFELHDRRLRCRRRSRLTKYAGSGWPHRWRQVPSSSRAQSSDVRRR